MKVCSKCNQEKPLSKFYKDKAYTDGYKCWCKGCSSLYQKSSKYRKTARKYAKKYYKEHKEQYANYRNKTRYGMTTEEREAFFDSKGRECEACGAKEFELNRGLFLDHCHKTGEVKGVLCNNCNAAAGMLSDNPDLVNALLLYLERTRKD